MCYLGQSYRRRPLIQDAHLVGQGVADDEAECIDGRDDEEPVGPVKFLAQAEEASVDAQGDEDVGDCEQNPFGYLGVVSGRSSLSERTAYHAVIAIDKVRHGVIASGGESCQRHGLPARWL